jgi:hypothetical protein
MTGLYDNQGVLRCAGRDANDCLAYAELFGLAADRYSLEALEAPRPLQSRPASCRSNGDQSLALTQG